jgi:hypothetical protein
MKKKLIGIIVCTMFIATIFIPISSAENICKDNDLSKNLFSNYEKGPEPPFMHTIEGPQSVQLYQYYTWTFKATDPDDLFVEIHIDWGEGGFETIRRWFSGVSISVGHIYGLESSSNIIGNENYVISAYAIDREEHMSNIETYSVTGHPRNHINSKINSNNRVFLKFTEAFPNAFPILQQIIGYL